MVPKVDMMTKIAHLPLDVLLHILSYTYRPQPAALVDDIRDYASTKASAMAAMYATYVLDWDIAESDRESWCRFFLVDQLYRFVRYSDYSFAEMFWLGDGYARSGRTQLNVLWGALTPAERREFVSNFTPLPIYTLEDL